MLFLILSLMRLTRFHWFLTFRFLEHSQKVTLLMLSFSVRFYICLFNRCLIDVLFESKRCFKWVSKVVFKLGQKWFIKWIFWVFLVVGPTGFSSRSNWKRICFKNVFLVFSRSEVQSSRSEVLVGPKSFFSRSNVSGNFSKIYKTLFTSRSEVIC